MNILHFQAQVPWINLSRLQSLINNDGPAIEYTLIGPTIQFNTQNTFVITGGSNHASLNNKTISMNSVILAEKGDILKNRCYNQGCTRLSYFWSFYQRTFYC